MTSPPAASRVARHTLLSLLGFVVPLAIAVIAIPVAARALGPARFGLLGLAWATVEYLGFFDLGLSRATVRFVADALARVSSGLKQIVAVSIVVQVALGGLAALAVLLAVPLIVSVLDISPELRAEAVSTFRAVAANIAVVLTMNALRGVLEGAQRFDYAVALRIPAAVAATAVPAVGAALGADVPTILWMVFGTRLVIVVALLVAVPHAIIGFRWEMPREWQRLRSLLGFSGWLALSGIASAALVNFDRFALAAIAGVAAVGFYTAPYEGAVRLLLIPHSMFAALFPALTATETLGSRERTTRLMESALRQLALLLGSIVAVVVVFAPEILRLWVGDSFAAEAGLALRILAIGVLVNAMAHIPVVFLYAAGRPDLPARLHVVELFIHLPLTVYLVRQFGITGAATAWTVRVALDAIGLAYFSRRLGGWRGGPAQRALWMRGLAAIALFAAALVAARFLPLDGPTGAAAIAAGGSAVTVWLIWTRALAQDERGAWRALLQRRLPTQETPPRGVQP